MGASNASGIRIYVCPSKHRPPNMAFNRSLCGECGVWREPVDLVPEEQLLSERTIERVAEVLLAHGGVDMTSEPPGRAREEYAFAVAQEVIAAALGQPQ